MKGPGPSIPLSLLSVHETSDFIPLCTVYLDALTFRHKIRERELIIEGTPKYELNQITCLYKWNISKFFTVKKGWFAPPHHYIFIKYKASSFLCLYLSTLPQQWVLSTRRVIIASQVLWIPVYTSILCLHIMVYVWMPPSPALMQSGKWLNLAFAIGLLSSAGTDDVSAAPTQEWSSIQYKEGGRCAFPLFAP